MRSLVFRNKFFMGFAKKPRMALVSTKNYDIEYFNKINSSRPADQQVHIEYFT